jgi:hypothetical protein
MMSGFRQIFLLNCNVSSIILHEDLALKSIPLLQDNKGLLNQYDFVIVVGGTAGCALASRLSKIETWNVLLIEAGPPPSFMNEFLNGALIGSEIDWQY